MEKKRNNLLLVSAIFGAVYIVGLIIFWVYVFSTEDFSQSGGNNTDVLRGLGIIISTVCIILSFIFNLIGLNKGSKRHILIAGILSVLGLNLVSAPLCIVEYYDGQSKIKNKLLYYTMIYTFIFNALLIALFLAAFANDEDKSIVPFLIYIIYTVSAGIILNFIAWKTGNNKAKIIAGIVYVLGLFTIISAVICFISGKDFLKAIKNKLLFYAMVFACVLGIPFIALMQFTIAPKDGVRPLIYPHTVYFLITTGIGFILNFIAWKTGKKTAKILAGIAYILGFFTVISAILCFISCKDSRKLPKAEEKTGGGA